MAIRKSPLDDVGEILQSAEVQKLIFNDLQSSVRGIREVEKFYKDFLDSLKEFDERWVKLCGNDESELTLWADRVRSMQNRLNELKRQINLGFVANKEAAITHMANLHAHRLAIVQTLALNE